MAKGYIAAVPLVLWLAGCGQAPEETHAAISSPAIPVETAPVTVMQGPATFEAIGTVRARTSAVISARLMGYVKEVRVQVGSHVEQGQLLVVLDSRDLDASVARAEAARDEVKSAIPEADSAVAAAKADSDLAQATFSRMQDLYSEKSISNQEFDESSARLKSAQAAYEMARSKRAQLDSKLAQAEQEARAAAVNRSYAEITAPFSGLVTNKPVEPGNLAIPGGSLLTIEREGDYRLEASVEESRLGAIRSGQKVAIKLDGLTRTVTGEVSEIVPEVNAESRAGTVKIDLPPLPELRSGVFGRASFAAGVRKVVAIPAAAVKQQGQLQSVLVAEGGAAHTRLVTLGERFRDRVEVLSGLNEGELVIVHVPQDLKDGARIEVRP